MRSFFIDLENVRSYGLEGILLLNPEDKVYVFYSDNANTLTIPTIESLNESSAGVKYIKTNYIGANAMDFQIVTLLGASIEKEQKGSFYIISHDNGFKSAVKFCEGYFTGYDIVTGVFANILLALNSEKNGKSETKPDQKPGRGSRRAENKVEKPKKQVQEPVAETRKQDIEKKNRKDEKPDKPNEAIPESKAKTDRSGLSDVKTEKNGDVPEKEAPIPRNRRRRNRNQKNREAAETVVQDETQKTLVKSDEAEAEALMTKDVSGTDGSVKAENRAGENPEPQTDPESKKNRSRNRRRKGKITDRPENSTEVKEESASDLGVQSETETPKAKKKGRKSVPDPAPVQKLSGNYRYVHNALSDYLSKNTIDMYAAKIDEGIKKSSTRKELHEFFKQSYGQDEAEALYKIISSDFDKMKKEAGK